MGTDEDKAAVLAVLEAETAAYLRRDMDGLAEFWVKSPEARRMYSYAHLGSTVYKGWNAINAQMRSTVVQYGESYEKCRVHRDGMNIVVIGDMAWASYDQVGDQAEDNFKLTGTMHELKIFHRLDGQWKIACIVAMQRAMDHETCPLIEVGPDKTVLWMNGQAHEQIASHPELLVDRI